MTNSRMGADRAKAKPRGLPFSGPDDPRRWTGRRAKDAEMAKDERDFRRILMDISREKVSGKDERGKAVKAQKLEMLARVYWGHALNGEIDFGNAILDRIFGRPTQPITGGLELDLNLSMEDLAKSFAELKAGND